MAHPQTPPTFNPVITGSDEYSVELNDANITAKAWKSSRYDGSKTETAVLNKYSEGDISVGKTTAVQKYSRNIYLGNGVIGMEENGGEDNNLVNFPNFSYITTLKYITVNADNTISTDIVESKPDDFNSRRGFYRSFYEDFPEKTSCKVIINDVSIKTNLKDSYEIYFNGGQLQKAFSLQTFTRNVSDPNTRAQLGYTPPSLGGGGAVSFVSATGTTDNLGADINFYNDNLIRNFYTGSTRRILGPNTKLADVQYFLTDYGTYRDNSSYIGDKRLFTSFCTQSGTPSDPSTGNEFEPIRTVSQDNLSASMDVARTKNLAELSSIEFNTVGGNFSNTLSFDFKDKFELNQGYNFSESISSPAREAFPPAFEAGTFMFSITEDATPSLLINLPKNDHLPDGIGRNGFVIVPDNLHPHVKKNLIHFLAKAGVSLDLDTIPALDTTFERLS